MANSAQLTAWLAQVDAIANNNGNAQITATIAPLVTRLTADETDVSDLKAVVTAMLTKLDAAPATGTGTGTLPVITSISPTTGPVAGGTVVTINGTGLSGATAVNFGTVAGTITPGAPNTDILLTVTSPATTAGQMDITVVTPAGTSAIVAADQFTSN